ncbi:GerMN domain-containing protein [Specibacter sp. RAF43]|uniref:GerMN domain-containing protein n=1 Tax=Specibacter sp. RAF43 TaxID=3233057 RepID=UPI003F9AE051
MPSRHRVSLAAAVLSVAVGLAGCTAGIPASSDHVMPTTASNTATSMVSSAPLETATTTQAIPVYWLGHSNDAVYLYREYLPAPSTDDPIVTALTAMMSRHPKDPDYFSVWNKPSRIGASISAKNVITVDVSADAFGQKVDRGIAERSVAQLVYTATAAAAMAGLIDSSQSIQVSILVDGHTGFNAFGHVPLNTPLTRETGFVAPIWIMDPANDTAVKNLPLKVSGQGISTTGTLRWSLSALKNGAAGDVRLSGTTAITKGPNELGGYSFTLAPPPGSYQLAVYATDPATPGARIATDTKDVTIVAGGGQAE